jgi:hypothetical protein
MRREDGERMGREDGKRGWGERMGREGENVNNTLLSIKFIE